VGEAADLARAVTLAETLQPQLIFVDGRIPTGALGAIDPLQRAAPGAQIAVIAALGELELVRAARARGARGALRRPLLMSQVAAVLEELASPEP
jgi:AmiR/NasT family two-component response regulator